MLCNVVVNENSYFKIYKPYGYLSQFINNQNKRRNKKLLSEIYDLPETIISRCQTWKLNKISEKKILEILSESHPEKQKEILEIMSFGSPTLGEATEMLNDSIFFEERQEGLRRIVKIINSPMSDKLNYSKELTQLYRKDKERVLYELKIWKNLFRKILKTEDMNEDLETISIMSPIKKANKLGIKKNIQNILKTEGNLKFNGMPSLVFDNFIINLEA